MGRRGSRSGSGRKSGAMHLSDRANPEQALRPLAVMLDNMRFYHQGAPELLEQLLIREATADLIAVQKDPAGMHREKLAVNEALKLRHALRQMAGKAAAHAAPYIHAKIAPTEHDTREQDFVPLHERIAAYERAASTIRRHQDVEDKG